MIAAGSLFTSCIQQLEPTGIQEMREAKAEYYEALAGLKNADAAKVLAEAEVEKAKAAVENAKAAQEQAKAKIEELKAEAAAMDNEQKAAQIEANIAAIEAAAAQAAVAAEEALAKAEAQLAKTLDDLAVQAEQLTPTEQWAVSAYVTAYTKYMEAQDLVYHKEKALWEATNAYGSGAKAGKTVEETLAGYEAEIAVAEGEIAFYEYRIDGYEAMSDAEKVNYGVWKAEYDSYVDSVEAMKYESAEIDKAEAYYNTLNADAFGKFTSALKLAQAVVDASVNDAKAGFKMDYTGENAFELPSSVIPVVGTFREKAQNIAVTDENKISFVNGKDLMEVKFNDPKVAYNAIFGDVEHPEKASLAGIIDALKRDSVVVDQLVKDTAGLAAAVAKVNAEYKEVKEALVKGRDAYKPVTDSIERWKKLDSTATAMSKAFDTDTAALFKSIKDFVTVWNKHADGNFLDHNDSLEIFNALKAVMAAREKVFSEYEPTGADARYYKYYISGPMANPVKDSVLFTELDFNGIQCVGDNYRALYAGCLVDDEVVWPEENDRNAMAFILTQAFGQTYPAMFWEGVGSRTEGNAHKIKSGPIDETDLYSNTQKYLKLFYETYRVNHQGQLWQDGVGEYTRDVAAAKQTANNAKEGIAKAKDNFYKNIYCKFWGDLPTIVYDEEHHKLVDGYDSLKINYTEKTYTEPYVLPVFWPSATATGKIFENGKFVWSNIDYNSTNAELVLIAEKLGQNNIFRHEFSLYAKKLAAEQIQDLAKNWKENTAALAELEGVVAAVEAAYVLAGLEVAEAKAMADSLVTAYLGEDMVEYIYAKEKDNLPKNPTPYDIWTLQNVGGKYVVAPTINSNNFYTKFCVGDKFLLGGLQLAAAEQFIPDFAETKYGFTAERAAINHDKDIYDALMAALNTYVQKLSEYDGYGETSGNVEQIYDKVQNYYKDLISGLKSKIVAANDKIALAEEKIAKLEAGFDPQQIAIEAAMAELAKAEAALEARETELAAATAAYQQVLENHDM